MEDHIVWECPHDDHPTGEQGPLFAEIFRKRSMSTPGDWLSFVADYSSCQITKETDRLPAIAGLAQNWPRMQHTFTETDTTLVSSRIMCIAAYCGSVKF